MVIVKGTWKDSFGRKGSLPVYISRLWEVLHKGEDFWLVFRNRHNTVNLFLAKIN